VKKKLPIHIKAAFIFFLLFNTSQSFSQPDINYQPMIGSSEGLALPIELLSAPGDASGKLFIVEKGGTVRIWNGSSLLPNPFLDITSRVKNDGEQGLLSMAFHPQYQSNGFFFVYYNNTDGDITIERYKVSNNPNITDYVASPPTTLMSISKNYGNHNGGHLQFRSEGGANYLYFATGDGGGSNDPDNNAQNPNSYLGKMIRINVDVTPYTPQIWATGLRNPFRWSFDKSTGDIWIGDVGQDAKEEINFRALGTGGANYGWACVEGTIDNAAAPDDADCDEVKENDVLPIMDYDNPADGRSVIGGYVYRGNEFPSLRGYYVATDFYTGKLWLIRPNGAEWDIIEKTGFATGIASISEAGNGSLYAVSLTQNAILKVVDPTVIPLTLVNFSGTPQAGYNELKWTTESEQNMDKYIVEYSNDGNNYSAVGEVVSENNVNRHHYTFLHTITSSNPVVYYRLKMLEFSGTHQFSAVIRIGNQVNAGIKVYPTTVSNNLLNIVTDKPVEKVVLTNSNGAELFAKDVNGASGYFTVTLPILQKGIYIVRVAGKSFQHIEKIVVQ
jgi:glucose/arabinose dehydrogenase